jgi:hypothetical protein
MRGRLQRRLARVLDTATMIITFTPIVLYIYGHALKRNIKYTIKT